ncbi:MAG: PEP/pyruvate-binding domain-containing protein [Deltaproteobacteria bacterium]
MRGEALRNWLVHVLGLPRGTAPRDLSALFSRFQAVLAANNRSLETITDLGEKLGGDYLFDINYTRAAYAELFSSISDSLENFTILTGNAYPALAEILSRIDQQVQRMLSEKGSASGPLTVFYPEITWDLAEVVGGKNYHLAILGNELGLKTPKAFAITTRSFELFLSHNQLTERIQNLATSQAAEADLTDLRSAVLAGSLPGQLTEAFALAGRKLAGRKGTARTLAVRSSAEEEDGDFSFAGQFESVLNVPATGEAIGKAWRQVVASLFTPRAVAYQKQLGYDLGRLRMAAACVTMIEARASGVIYTVAGPGRDDIILINAAWGLGPAVVDGITDADLYLVKKGETPEISECRLGRKEVMVVPHGEDGVETIPTPMEERNQSCLSEIQILALARQAQQIEKHFQSPQDIEWAMDAGGEIYILQSRALKIDKGQTSPAARRSQSASPDLPVLIKAQGVVVRPGITAGRVFVLKSLEDLEQVPQGAMLVARHDSSQYVRVIPFVNAIITDTGVATSHMASICREFEIPTVVNTGNATELLPEGKEVTLMADSEGKIVVYAGVAHELLRKERRSRGRLRELYEFRRQKYLMRYIAPLQLVNPLEEQFVPEKCRSIHDLIRFMHEKAVQALVNGAGMQARSLVGRLFGRQKRIRDLALPLPIRMLIIDIGGALAAGGGYRVDTGQLRSRPLKAILRGMLEPGVWHDEAMPLKGRDLLAGMTRTADPGTLSATAGANLAVASAEYVNLSLRFGYHFNMLDSYCTDQPRNNHIFFRFVGGAATITHRSLRIHFMDRVMNAYGFLTKPKGDLLVARISNLPAEEVERLLTNLGRLIGCARQLDAAMVSTEAAEQLAADFLAGKIPKN